MRTEEKVTVNGSYRHFNELIYPGEKVALELEHVESLQQQYPASGKMPEIIFEDENLLVINKPAGQKTHPNLNETNTALNDCTTYLGKSPFIVHRLDMLTSGLLLVAKNPAVVPILNRELTTKIFHREYLTVVNHADKLDQKGTIALPIGRDPLDQRKRMITEDGLKAITNYTVLEKKADNTALLKVSLETGRTHQIRVHLSALGCPIVGDPLYSPDFKTSKFLHLTAYKMSFTQPFSFTTIKVKLPEEKIRI